MGGTQPGDSRLRSEISHPMIARCLLLAVLLPGVPAVYACSCAQDEGPAEEMKLAQAVSLGRPVLVSTGRQPETGWLFDIDLIYSFSNPWMLKGAKGSRKVETSSYESACGRSLKPGRLYLVYAHAFDEEKLGISLCSRTRPWFLAAPDILYAGTRINLRDWQFAIVVVALIVGALFWRRRGRRASDVSSQRPREERRLGR